MEKETTTQITETPTQPEVVWPVEGEVLSTPDGDEVVVWDRDKDGEPTGWHKEAVDNG